MNEDSMNLKISRMNTRKGNLKQKTKNNEDFTRACDHTEIEL